MGLAMQPDIEALRKHVDASTATLLQDSPRRHLGASIIGRKCAREIFYSFRWARIVKHTGRLLRLFDRGHREEAAIARWFRAAGATVVDADPDTGEQFKMPLDAATLGHYGGSCDGFISGLDAFGLSGWGLLEDKTHSAKSWAVLHSKGVVSAKIEHYAQMQVYGDAWNLPWALYVGVRKDDDALHLEAVAIQPEVAIAYRERAAAIITASAPPPRISKVSTWWQCRICDFHNICHHGAALEQHCRTCAASSAVEGGRWYCSRWRMLIPQDAEINGCEEWTAIPE